MYTVILLLWNCLVWFVMTEYLHCYWRKQIQCIFDRKNVCVILFVKRSTYWRLVRIFSDLGRKTLKQEVLKHVLILNTRKVKLKKKSFIHISSLQREKHTSLRKHKMHYCTYESQKKNKHIKLNNRVSREVNVLFRMHSNINNVVKKN